MTEGIDEMHEGIEEASDKGKPTLRRITDWCQRRFNAPWLYIAAPVYSWLGWGVDLERDVKPVVERYIAARGDPPKSLAWLNDKIAASIRQRSQPMPETPRVTPHERRSAHTGFDDRDYYAGIKDSGFDVA